LSRDIFEINLASFFKEGSERKTKLNCEGRSEVYTKRLSVSRRREGRKGRRREKRSLTVSS